MYAPWKRLFPSSEPRYTPDLDGLIAFLTTIDPKQTYDFWNPNCCALAEFSKANFGTPDYHRTLKHHHFHLDVIAILHPWTYGALLWRAQAVRLLRERYSMDAIVTALLLEMRKRHNG